MNNNIKRKDWVGGSAAVFKTLGASNHTNADRQREDYYATEPKATEWLCKLERLTKPRWLGVTGLVSERWLGAFCLLLALVLVLPIPLGNLPPAVAVALVALGLIEKDGIFVALGLVVGAGSLVLVAGIVSAMALTVIFFMREVLS